MEFELLILPLAVTTTVTAVVIREIVAVIRNSNRDVDKQEEEAKQKISTPDYFPEPPLRRNEVKPVIKQGLHPEPF